MYIVCLDCLLSNNVIFEDTSERLTQLSLGHIYFGDSILSVSSTRGPLRAMSSTALSDCSMLTRESWTSADRVDCTFETLFN